MLMNFSTQRSQRPLSHNIDAVENRYSFFWGAGSTPESENGTYIALEALAPPSTKWHYTDTNLKWSHQQYLCKRWNSQPFWVLAHVFIKNLLIPIDDGGLRLQSRRCIDARMYPHSIDMNHTVFLLVLFNRRFHWSISLVYLRQYCNATLQVCQS